MPPKTGWVVLAALLGGACGGPGLDQVIAEHGLYRGCTWVQEREDRVQQRRVFRARSRATISIRPLSASDIERLTHHAPPSGYGADELIVEVTVDRPLEAPLEVWSIDTADWHSGVTRVELDDRAARHDDRPAAPANAARAWVETLVLPATLLRAILEGRRESAGNPDWLPADPEKRARYLADRAYMQLQLVDRCAPPSAAPCRFRIRVERGAPAAHVPAGHLRMGLRFSVESPDAYANVPPACDALSSDVVVAIPAGTTFPTLSVPMASSSELRQ
jgi:hypothetical protein